jgi:spermidine synthase
VSVELLRDADRRDGWWLMVDGSEQSFIDTADPLHLEFEYVQMVACLLDALFPSDAPVAALHLGGGLSTIPRWLAARHPGSRQRVAEHSGEIAALSATLGDVPGTVVEVADAVQVVTDSPSASLDLLVCDVYDGPDTVTGVYTLEVVRAMRRLLRPGGVLVANISDATPFALAKVAVAGLRATFDSVAVMAEPATLRGRRSGNVVLVATNLDLPVADITRRAIGGAIRFRVMAGDELTGFVGGAGPVVFAADMPLSGESTGRRLL